MRELRRSALVVVAIATLGALAVVPATTATASATRPDAGAPAGFTAQSTSWLDKQQGFLLGTAPCGDATCSDVIATTDGGATWHLRGRVHAPIRSDGGQRPGVGEVRFSDASHGWAFGPLLRHTADGGRTWSVEAIPGDLGQVLSLATDADGTWAVVSPCRWQHSGRCRNQPVTLWRTTTPTSARWSQIDAALPYSYSANVSAFGSSVYVSDGQLEYGQDDVLLVSTDGTTFQRRTAPCDHTQDIALIQVVATSATNASLLCDGDPGFSKAVKIVYNTKDNATTYRNRGTMGLYGIQAQLAASPSGNLAVASWSDGSFIYINDSHTQNWQMPVAQGDGGLGWNDIVYVSGRDAYVVYSPAGSFNALGRLWASHDGGRDWADVSP